MGGTLIPKARLGRTGLDISRVGFGGAPIGDIRRASSDADSRQMLQQAWDSGMRYFDTAPFYGSGLSERRIGDFLRDKSRDDYVLSTKVGRLLLPDRAYALEKTGNPRALPFRPEFDFSYDGILRSYEQSLQRLGLERIDILFAHDIGRFSQRERHEASLRQLLDGGIRALTELRDSGAVRGIGAGVNEWQILDELMDHAQWDVFLLANRYTLLDQDTLAAFLPRCQREGVAIICGAPLHSGILATGAIPGATYDYAPASEAMLEKVRTIEAICQRYGVPLIGAALNFPLGHPAITAIIPGYSVSAELASNLAQYRMAIPSELWADLKATGLLNPAAPEPVTPVLK